jgi:hypothetical protein
MENKTPAEKAVDRQNNRAAAAYAAGGYKRYPQNPDQNAHNRPTPGGRNDV